MLRSVPAVEVADDADVIRIWRPDRERDATFAFVREAVSPELFIDVLVPAFAEQMEIYGAQGWRKVGFAQLPLLTRGLLTLRVLASLGVWLLARLPGLSFVMLLWGQSSLALRISDKCPRRSLSQAGCSWPQTVFAKTDRGPAAGPVDSSDRLPGQRISRI